MVAYESLKTKENSCSISPKVVAVAVAYGAGCIREPFITKTKLQFNQGFRESWSLTRVVTSSQYLQKLLNKQNKLANYQGTFLHG